MMKAKHRQSCRFALLARIVSMRAGAPRSTTTAARSPGLSWCAGGLTASESYSSGGWGMSPILGLQRMRDCVPVRLECGKSKGDVSSRRYRRVSLGRRLRSCGKYYASRRGHNSELVCGVLSYDARVDSTCQSLALMTARPGYRPCSHTGLRPRASQHRVQTSLKSIQVSLPLHPLRVNHRHFDLSSSMYPHQLNITLIASKPSTHHRSAQHPLWNAIAFLPSRAFLG
ncbi:uncharacterized protein B0H18DRAFT_53965 [Fomitopsis serialis]|uniref:uncharacterized protein n=1 Tax=Fomitopsis serialis TaxID=139415 RepID=UPI002008E32B|nr:uncharacterized protein B0H18DRAFT_53965 [Neoantrodia serialis]KAH9932346.1 hypothetical protein B0H18DRAFT_53965 [Neoantrodia serialis]